MVVVAYS